MNALQKSIATIGLGVALAVSLPTTVVAGGPAYGHAVGYGHPGQHYGHGPHWRHYKGKRHWRHHDRRWHPRHHHHRGRVVERVVYEPLPAEASEPAIVISPNIQLGGGGGYEGSAAPSSTLGTVVGAVAGAAIGSQIGKGRGNTAAIAIGSVVGGHLGGRMASY